MTPGFPFARAEEARVFAALVGLSDQGARRLTARELAAALPGMRAADILAALAAAEEAGLCEAWISGDGSRDLIDRIAFSAETGAHVALMVAVKATGEELAGSLASVLSAAELAEIEARARLRREAGAER